MVDVSVIIVNYNTTSLLLNSLGSLFALTSGVEVEVIVVDNASSEPPTEILRALYNDKVRVVVSPKNLGFGLGNNLGAEHAKGRYLFLLNPDTILVTNAIKILVDFMDSRPLVGVAGGNLYSQHMRPTVSFKYFPDNLWFELDSFFYEPVGRIIYGRNRVFNHTSAPIEVAYIVGADMMIRHNIWVDLGGFDSDFFMYSEENELEFRVSKAGYSITSVPQAQIIHLEGGSYQNSEKRERAMLNGKILYYKKCYGKRAARTMVAIRKAQMLSRIAVLWTLCRHKALERHKMLYKILCSADI